MRDFALKNGVTDNPSWLHDAQVLLGRMRENHPASVAGQWFKSEKAKGNEPTLKE
jgi:hypothetical protein